MCKHFNFLIFRDQVSATSVRTGRLDATARSARRVAMETRQCRWVVANAIATDTVILSSTCAIGRPGCASAVTTPKVTNASVASAVTTVIHVTAGCAITAACRGVCWVAWETASRALAVDILNPRSGEATRATRRQGSVSGSSVLRQIFRRTRLHQRFRA